MPSSAHNPKESPTERENVPPGTQSPEEQAVAQARKCWKSVAKLTVGKPDSKIRAYHRIGVGLIFCIPAARARSYRHALLRVFADEWVRQGGFPLCRTAAKYAREFAEAFDPALLNKALRAKLNWSCLRAISRTGLTAKDRGAVVRWASRRPRSLSEVQTEVRKRVQARKRRAKGKENGKQRSRS